MSVLAAVPADLRDLAKAPDVRAAVTRMLGRPPQSIAVERVHFPGRRPVQVTLSVRLQGGQTAPVLAELCPDDPDGHADGLRSSLRKSRNGQKQGLGPRSIDVARQSRLVLRQIGLDDRLPGLRLLYDPSFADDTVRSITGEPGPVLVELVAHRLGKRAVLRLTTARRVIFARLRAIKSGEGATRLSRHRDLWRALVSDTDLRIPEPLGALPELGVSFFATLPGEMPRFDTGDSAVIVRALDTLQALRLRGLPLHSAMDEARLLSEWQARCARWRPDLAARITPTLSATQAALTDQDRPAKPCHRDLHEKQILMAEGVAGLLDFDTLCLADPALDAGNLLAHLFLAGVNEAPLRAALDAPGIDLWRRAALLRLAMIYGVTSTPDPKLHRLIDEACRTC